MDINFETSSGKKYSIPASEAHFNHVKRTITKNDHPNPLLIVIIVIVVILLLWYIYIKRTKLDLSGSWYNNKGEKIDIQHCPWSDNVTVIKQGIDLMHGQVDGVGIYLHNRSGKPYAGVYKDNVIYWNNGDVWKMIIFMN